MAEWSRAPGILVFDKAAGMADKDVLSKAFSGNRILITNNKDFGEMIFRERRQHKGVVFLRLANEGSANKIDVLRNVLENYSDKLPGQFVTVTENRIRFA
ncbi:MAG: DUF5615 family PIN-like protein [Blastocatellia bacterium]